jgi:hypothetical protein
MIRSRNSEVLGMNVSHQRAGNRSLTVFVLAPALVCLTRIMWPSPSNTGVHLPTLRSCAQLRPAQRRSREVAVDSVLRTEPPHGARLPAVERLGSAVLAHT